MGIKEGLLAVLSRGEAHGYQIKLELEAATGDSWRINIGQVYTTLQRLVRDGLVEPVNGEIHGRIQYTITTLGREALAEWMTTPVELAAAGRDEITLKILLAISSGTGDARRVIEIQRGAVMGLLQDYTALKAADDSADLAWLLYLDRLILSAEAELRWLERVESRLEKEKPLRRAAVVDLPEIEEVVR